MTIPDRLSDYEANTLLLALWRFQEENGIAPTWEQLGHICWCSPEEASRRFSELYLAGRFWVEIMPQDWLSTWAVTPKISRGIAVRGEK